MAFGWIDGTGLTASVEEGEDVTRLKSGQGFCQRDRRRHPQGQKGPLARQYLQWPGQEDQMPMVAIDPGQCALRQIVDGLAIERLVGSTE